LSHAIAENFDKKDRSQYNRLVGMFARSSTPMTPKEKTIGPATQIMLLQPRYFSPATAR
jgi:hypothetical protein